MTHHFIFCHGWGFDEGYWDNLRPYFLQKKRSYLNLGYFGKENLEIPYGNQKEFIGVGHSLGLIKLLSLGIEFKALIGIQGFYNFLGNEPSLKAKRYREWDHLRRTFALNPLRTLKAFYKRAGIDFFENSASEVELGVEAVLKSSCSPSYAAILRSDSSAHPLPDASSEKNLMPKKEKEVKNLDINKLLADLNRLPVSIELPTHIPLLILASQNDETVPPELIKDNFTSHPHVAINRIETGKHCLGYFHADWVYEKIMSFLNGIE